MPPSPSSSDEGQARLRGCWDWTGPDRCEDSVETCPGPVLSCDLNPTPHCAAGGPWASVSPHVKWRVQTVSSEAETKGVHPTSCPLGALCGHPGWRVGGVPACFPL